MCTIITRLWYLDAKQIMRDKIYMISLLAVPLISISALHFFLPIVTQLYPWTKDYTIVAIVFLAFQTGVLPGFIVSFIMLEEKDNNTRRALFVTCLTPQTYLNYRLTLTWVSGFILSCSILLFAEIGMGLITLLAIAILTGLIAIVLALIITLLAENKVEGLAWFKGLNLILIIPAIVFNFNVPWSEVFFIIPTWWLFKIANMLQFGDINWTYVLTGLLVISVEIGILEKMVLKRL